VVIYEDLQDDEIELLINEGFSQYRGNISRSGKIYNELYDVIVADGLIKEVELQVLDKLKDKLEG
jgi:fatty acid/phospholipid biosynthesis enzyme